MWRGAGNYAGTSALPADPTIRSFDTVKTGRRLPQWEAVQFFADRQPITPALWREDLYFHEQNKYTANRAVTEEVTAGYAMAQGRVGRTGFITGVRTEKTDTSELGLGSHPQRQHGRAADGGSGGLGAARLRQHPAPAQWQLYQVVSERASHPRPHPEHQGAAELVHELRPPGALNNALLPNETISEPNQTLTVNNPGLRPQTAENWDAALDYYFEPVGNLSVAWFHKTIKDYIVTGTNAGTIGTRHRQWLQRRVCRLHPSDVGQWPAPRWCRVGSSATSSSSRFSLAGSRASARRRTSRSSQPTATSAAPTERATDEVPGFIPRTGNASLSWRHKRFSTRVLYNYTGDYITAFTAASVGRNLYRYSYSTVTAGVAYQYRPWLQFTADVANLFNEPQSQYRGIPDQMANTIINGTTITLGVNGRF